MKFTKIYILLTSIANVQITAEKQAKSHKGIGLHIQEENTKGP